MRAIGLAVALGMGAAAFAPQADAEWIIGAKTGPVDVGTNLGDEPTNVAFMAGWQTGVVLGEIGVEAELSRTTKKGGAAENVEYDSQAIYVAFRTAGPLYLKAKAGQQKGEITSPTVNRDDSMTAYGVGLGLGLGLLQIELEFTKAKDFDFGGTKEDINFLSLGIQF